MFSPGQMQIQDINGATLLSADLTDVVAHTNTSLPDFTATLSDITIGAGNGSLLADTWASDLAAGATFDRMLDTNFVSGTNGFTQDYSYAGFAMICDSVAPEPSSLVILTLAAVPLGLGYWCRHGRHAGTYPRGQLEF
jgi:hypothetical protein